jgi:hypothetical protein
VGILLFLGWDEPMQGRSQDLSIEGVSRQQSYVIKCIYDNNIDNIQIKVYFTIYIKEKISEYYKEK